MSAYLIFTREQTLNPDELATYAKEIVGTFPGHEMKLLAEDGAQQDLEGPPTEGTVVVEFPSMEAARAWYDSPAYTAVRQHRLQGAVYRVLLVQGV